MLVADFKVLLATKEMDRVGNLYMLKHNVPNKKLSCCDTNNWNTYSRTKAETIEKIKQSVCPEVLYRAAFHAVEGLGCNQHTFQCLLADPANPQKVAKSTIEHEYLLHIMPYEREGYDDPTVADRIERNFPLITHADLENPEFCRSAQLPIDDCDEVYPSARFRFRATFKGVEKIYLATLKSGYPTL